MVERTKVVFNDDGSISEMQNQADFASKQENQQSENNNVGIDQINVKWPSLDKAQSNTEPSQPTQPRIQFDQYGNILSINDDSLMNKVIQESKAQVIYDSQTGEIISVHDQQLMDKLMSQSQARVLFDETGNIVDIKDVGLLDEIQKLIGTPNSNQLPNLRAAFDEKGEVRRIMDREAMVQSLEWIYPAAFDGGPRYIHTPEGQTLQIMDFNNFDQVHEYASDLRNEIQARAQDPAAADVSIFMPVPQQPEITPSHQGYQGAASVPFSHNIRPLQSDNVRGTENLFYEVFGCMTVFLGIMAMWVMVYLNRSLVKQKLQEARKKASRVQFTSNDTLLNADNYDDWPDISNNSGGSMFQRSSSGSQANKNKKQDPDDGFSKQ